MALQLRLRTDCLTAPASTLQEHIAIDDGDDDQVVQDVNGDGSQQSKAEHDVEERHADEPVVDHTELAGVLVAVTVCQVRAEHGGADHPTLRVGEKPAQVTECGQVGQRCCDIGVSRLNQPLVEEETSEHPVENLHPDDTGEQIAPAEQDLLPDATGDRELDALSQDALSMPVIARLVVSPDAPGHCDNSAPDENPLAGVEPVKQRTLHFPELENADGHHVRPEVHDQADHDDRLESEECVHDEGLLRQSIHVVEVGDPRKAIFQIFEHLFGPFVPRRHHIWC